MVWFFYNILFVVGFVLLLPHFCKRMWKRGGYRKNFLQRLAVFDAETRRELEKESRVWIHAVSVGETYVAFRFMEAMRKARPDLSFVLSTTTSTAHAIARGKMVSPDVLLYFPVDIPPVMRRMVRLIRPRLLILVETEFWPNLIRISRRNNIPVVLINGRISQKSFGGYRKLRMFTRRLLPELNAMFMQSAQDHERLVALGAPPEKVFVPGSAKYEIVDRNPEGEAQARQVLRQAGIHDQALVILGGSTWAGEEAVLLDSYREMKNDFPTLALVLVPRHFERSDEVIAAIEQRGMTYVRRSQLQGDTTPDKPVADVLLVDTTGELKNFYASATVIFVGKSLTVHGGQNVIEPAVCRKPIVVGPNMENFPAIMEDFLSADALRQVRDAHELKATIRALLADENERNTLGARAGRLLEEKAGAVDKTLAHVLPLIRPAS